RIPVSRLIARGRKVHPTPKGCQARHKFAAARTIQRARRRRPVLRSQARFEQIASQQLLRNKRAGAPVALAGASIRMHSVTRRLLCGAPQSGADYVIPPIKLLRAYPAMSLSLDFRWVKSPIRART